MLDDAGGSLFLAGCTDRALTNDLSQICSQPRLDYGRHAALSSPKHHFSPLAIFFLIKCAFLQTSSSQGCVGFETNLEFESDLFEQGSVNLGAWHSVFVCGGGSASFPSPLLGYIAQTPQTLCAGWPPPASNGQFSAPPLTESSIMSRCNNHASEIFSKGNKFQKFQVKRGPLRSGRYSAHLSNMDIFWYDK